ASPGDAGVARAMSVRAHLPIDLSPTDVNFGCSSLSKSLAILPPSADLSDCGRFTNTAKEAPARRPLQRRRVFSFAARHHVFIRARLVEASVGSRSRADACPQPMDAAH